jgi:hypothetical protein
MFYNLLFQILLSWLLTSCLVQMFYKRILAEAQEVYREPAFLTLLLSLVAIRFTKKAKDQVSKVLYHSIGICFAAIYYLLWYYEFAEISFSDTVILGVTAALLRILSWILLFVILPATSHINFKGYYLQLVFLHNVFTITVILLYRCL